MLSYIKGTIKNIDHNSVILFTQSGLGYEIIINELIYSKILSLEEVEMFVYHQMSENGQSLFGFLDIEERVLFKELIKISGVGGKVAQMILSLGSSRLKQAIVENDKKTIESIKGVGKKMAEKIVLELSDKDIIKNFSGEKLTGEKKGMNISTIHSDLKSEIVSTLSLMGYNTKKVEEILNHLPDGFETVDTIIPFVIKQM